MITAILWSCLILLPAKGYAVGLGDKAFDFHLVTTEGKTISYYRDLKGEKPVYLIFWTAW